MIFRLAVFYPVVDNIFLNSTVSSVILKSGLSAKEQGQLIFGTDSLDVNVYCGEFTKRKHGTVWGFKTNGSECLFNRNRVFKYLKNKDEHGL